MEKTNKKPLLVAMLVVLLSAMLLVGGLTISASKPQVDSTVKAEATSATLSRSWDSSLHNITNLTITNNYTPQSDSYYVRIEDVSLAQDGSLKAYVFENGKDAQNNTLRDCVIYGDVDTIYAPEDSRYLFYGSYSTLQTIKFDNFDTSNVTDMSYMFYYCSSLTMLDLNGFNTSNVTDMSWMFYGCSSLISLDLSNFNTSNVTNMQGMFADCNSLTSLDVSNFDTSKVTGMYSIFYNCSSLTSLDVSNFNTSNVTDMESMFDRCSSLTSLDISGFDTSNVTDMSLMFSGCSSLTSLDLSGFNTSNVTDMRFMFSNCSLLTSLDVSGFDTSNVTNMREMFDRCSSLTSLDVSGFDTSNVTSMRSMFSTCTSLKQIDVSNFNTQKVTDFFAMFACCSSLEVLDLSSFDFSSVTSANEVLGFIGINDTMVLAALSSYGSVAADLLTSYQQAITIDSDETRIAVVAVALQNLLDLSQEDAPIIAQGLFDTSIKTIYAPISVNGLNISLPYNNNDTFVYDSGSGEVQTAFLVGRDNLEELAIYPQNTTPLEKPEISPSTPATGFDTTDLIITTTLGMSLLVLVAVAFVGTKKKYGKR